MRPILVALACLALLFCLPCTAAASSDLGFALAPGEILVAVNGVPVGQRNAVCNGPGCKLLKAINPIPLIVQPIKKVQQQRPVRNFLFR